MKFSEGTSILFQGSGRRSGNATPNVRKYGQILERNGYGFLKDGDSRIFNQFDIEALIALRDTDKLLDDTKTFCIN